ncbi:MAG: hypothetical protein RJQ04_03025 [Longimicrobiales bacterium]
MPRFLSTVAVVAALASAPAAGAQTHPSIPLLPAAAEAELARSAATPDISAEASVWVLAAGGLVLHEEGTNGWTCLVERDHPKSLAPLCYDPEGTRAILPGIRRLEALRAGGMEYRDAMAVVEEEYRTGTLPEPARPVLSYMLSKDQRLHSSPEGPAVGHWKPHVMIFHPSFSNEALALPAGGLGGVSSVGRVFTYLVVPVARWSDGTLAEVP